MAEQATPLQSQAGLLGHTQQPDRACAARIAQAVQAAYTALPKTGKPQPNEHTVLAGIVAYTAAPTHSSHQAQQQQPMRVVALGTGSKCLGASKRSPIGDVLNDSHAEVIARRAFVAWALQQLQLAVQSAQQQQHPQHSMAQQEPQQQQQPTPASSTVVPPVQDSQHGSQQSGFTWCPDTRRFALRPGLHFALYISQPPCGDASIFSTPGQAQAGCWEDQGPGDAVPAAAAAGAAGEPAQQQQQQAVGRTGAKVLRPLGAADVAEAAAATAAAAAAGAHDTPQQHVRVGSSELTHPAAEQQQQQQQQACIVPTARDVEVGPQQLAVLRRKPGKGDPTLSLSCSDKIARWACLGLQGCLLSSLLQEPLYLSMLVVSVPGTGAAPGAGAAGGVGGEGVPQQQPDQQQQQQQQQAASDAANAAGTGQQHPSNQQQQEQAQQPQHGQAGTQQALPAVLAAAEAAGRRAVGERVMACTGVLQPPYRAVPPAVVVVEAAPAGLGLQPGGARDVPSGTSVNWSCQLPLLSALTQQRAGSKQYAGGVHEATSAAFGCKHGTARKGPAATSVKTRSRLCSATLFGQWQKLLESLPPEESAAAAAGAKPSDEAEPLKQEPGAEGEQRAQAKRGAGAAYQHMWLRLKATPTFAGWLAK